MTPQRFEQANGQLGPPKGWTDDQCSTIHVFRGRNADGSPVTISAWKPSPEDLVKINLGENIYLFVTFEANGEPTMPPTGFVIGDPWGLEQPASSRAAQ